MTKGGIKRYTYEVSGGRGGGLNKIGERKYICVEDTSGW